MEVSLEREDEVIGPVIAPFFPQVCLLLRCVDVDAHHISV